MKFSTLTKKDLIKSYENKIPTSLLNMYKLAFTNVNKHINRLTAFTDWQANKIGKVSMNPLRDATPHEYRLNYASWFRKNQNDYLGHIEDKTINKTIRKARHIKVNRPEFIGDQFV